MGRKASGVWHASHELDEEMLAFLLELADYDCYSMIGFRNIGFWFAHGD